MFYTSLAWCARRALQWCYREVSVAGSVPSDGPLLLAVNHPNELPDVCAVLAQIPRRVNFVANVSAAEQPLVGWAYRKMGVVPVHRVRDVRKARARGEDSSQANIQAFARVRELLVSDSCVCVFPEGGVHRGPQIGSLRSGLARMALDARDAGHVRGLRVIPVGINYEAPGTLRSRVRVEIGAPLALDEWQADPSRPADAQLTADIRDRMSEVTGNPLPAPSPSSNRSVAELAAAVVRAPLAMFGLLLHAPAWLAIDRLARRVADEPGNVMARRILPGMYVMAAWYVVLIVGGWHLASALAARRLPAFEPAISSSAIATLFALLLSASLPTLGTMGLRWRDALANGIPTRTRAQS